MAGSRPCSSRAGPPRARARRSSVAHGQRVAERARARSARRAPVAAGVVGQRGQAVVAAQRARSRSGSPSRSRRRAGSPRRPRARPRAGTARTRARRARPARAAPAVGCFIIAQPMAGERHRAGAGRRRAARSPAGWRASTRSGSRLSAGRACCEIGGCDALELAREFGTPAYVYAEDDMRARARATRRRVRRTAPSGSRCSTRARRSPAPPRCGSSPRRGCRATCASRRRAAPGAGRRLRPRADLHARQQQDRRRAGGRAGGRRSAT